jgi:predicted RNA-binding Zn ribbon-like protein
VLPDRLEPVLAFINTVDVEEGTDDLAGGPAALADWLRAREPSPQDSPPRVTRVDFQLALDLRTGLRTLALANNGVPASETELERLSRTLDQLPLIADAKSGLLHPYRLPPVRAALATVVAGYAHAAASGEWQRIRRCPAEDCAWAFWDSSPKGTRRWCVMSVCGNRAKVRAFARRKAGEA